MNISIRNLEFQYQRFVDNFKLSIAELDIPHSSQVAIIGPSGSGKSTLLKILAGILVPQSGSICIGDHSLLSIGDDERRLFRAAQIGFVFQEFELVEYLNVENNILLPLRLHAQHRVTSQSIEFASSLADQLGIHDKLKRSVKELSQGERQRVAIARSLIHNPSLILADEPTGNLDPSNKNLIVDLLRRQVSKHNASLIMVTHDHGLLDGWDQVIDFGKLLSVN